MTSNSIYLALGVVGAGAAIAFVLAVNGESAHALTAFHAGIGGALAMLHIARG